MDADNVDQNRGDDGEDRDNESLSEDDESSINEETNYWSDDDDDGYDDAEKLNKETHDKIKLNDADITSLEVNLTGEFVQNVDWSTEGKFIGDNTQLKKIEIISDEWSEEINTLIHIFLFCTGLARNRSIEAFYIFDSDLSAIFQPLQPFFINTNLVHIEFYESDIGEDNTHLLAVALEKRSNKDSLEVLGIHSCNMGGEHVLGELIKALEGYRNLTKLSLHECGLGGRQCFDSLANILLKPDCRLEKLDLEYNNVGNPQDSVTLANALSKNTSLKCLDFTSSRVDEDEAVELCNSLVKNNTLKCLKLSNTPMSSVGLRSLSNRYQYLISSLTYLDLSYCRPPIDDQEASILGGAINVNTTLKGLILNNIGNSITSAGWQAFSVCLQSPNSTLTRLSLDACNLDDEKMIIIATTLANNSMITDLDLNQNVSIGVRGWQSLSSCLSSPISALKRLGMFGCNLNDEIVIGFAEELSHNTSLCALSLWNNSGIANRSWDALHRTICNTSSIEAIFESNHTLHYVGRSLDHNITSSLQLNENQDKKQVARQKIIQHYFLKDEDVDVREFVTMDMNVLPQAMTWIGKEHDDVGGHTLMFAVLKGMPCLFDTESKTRASSKARKKRRVL